MNLKLSIVNYPLTILLLLFFALPLKAQVTIGKDSIPHSFSILELRADQVKGGLRLPQLNTAQREDLTAGLSGDEAAAAKGLVVYDIEVDCLEYWNGATWIDLCSNTSPVSIANSITLASPAGTDAQTVCAGSGITPVTYSTTGATGATVSGLPSGVSGVWNADVVSISGAPATTASGAYNYTVTLTGGSSTGTATGTITVNPQSTIVLTSGQQNQSVAQTTAMVATVYTFGGSATDASVVNLPAGLTPTVDKTAKTVTISGTPTVGGTYTVNTSGNAAPCSPATISGTITLTACQTPNEPGVISGNQTPCANGTPQTYSITAVSGATSYTWTVPTTGWTGSTTTSTPSFSATPGINAISGNIAVKANNSCGSSTERTLAVTINTAPQVAISGQSGVAKSTAGYVYTANLTSGTNVTYSWSVSGAGWSIPGSNTDNTVTVTSGTADGTISVTATNGCGSNTASMTVHLGCAVQSTLTDPPYNGWITFMCYNLGASANVQNMTPKDQAAATAADNYGDLYQWGRIGDDHQFRNPLSAAVAGPMSGTNLDATTGQVIGANVGKFITSTIPYDWCSPQNDNLWNFSTYPTNNPCPSGWRVPTLYEWSSIFRVDPSSGGPGTATTNTWTWNSTGTPGFLIKPSGSTEATLFLPAAGNRLTSGAINGVGTFGYYWSSSPYSTIAYTFTFSKSSLNTGDTNVRGYGLSVRCVSE